VTDRVEIPAVAVSGYYEAKLEIAVGIRTVVVEDDDTQSIVRAAWPTQSMTRRFEPGVRFIRM
jgi:hypothetical protein